MEDVVLNIVTLVDAGEGGKKPFALVMISNGERVSPLKATALVRLICSNTFQSDAIASLFLNVVLMTVLRRTDIGIEVVFEFGRGAAPRADGNVAAIRGGFGRLPGPFKHVLDELWEISHRRSCFRNDDRPLVLLYSTTRFPTVFGVGREGFELGGEPAEVAFMDSSYLPGSGLYSDMRITPV